MTRTLSSRASYKKVGPDLVQKVAKTYQQFLDNPNSKTRNSYLIWRLRIHLRCNSYMKEELEVLNDNFQLGLNDEEAGPLMWEYERG